MLPLISYARQRNVKMKLDKMLYKISCFALLLLLNTIFATQTCAQKFDEKFEHWPVELKINGRIIIHNQLTETDSEPLLQLWERIAKSKTVNCFTKNGFQDQSHLPQQLQKIMGSEGNFQQNRFEQFPAEKFRKACREADVIILQADQDFLQNPETVQALKKDITQFIENKKTIIVNQHIAAILGKFFIIPAISNHPQKISTGLNLIPDAVLLCEFDHSKQATQKLSSLLAVQSVVVGIGLPGKTTLMLSGRKMTCYGEGKTTFMVKANEYLPSRVESIIEKKKRNQKPQEYLLDYTQWRRQAIERTLERFPPVRPERPFVENGTLFIVGGGGMPAGLMDQFIELAGGKEKAKLVYIPCSEQEKMSKRQYIVEAWKKRGVRHASYIHTKDRNQANHDEEFLAVLKNASGIWFGGGRQWNLADSYYGTTAHRLMKEVLHRGGVIGGSSAGASIQARYLARATPIGNFQLMAPGYERGGLGFISGVAIDQHFSQRGRQKNMTQLVNRYPQLLGIGLDEATAIIVKKSNAEIVGRGQVFFYNRKLPLLPGKPDYVALPAGSLYDLANRKILINTTKKISDPDSKDECQK